MVYSNFILRLIFSLILFFLLFFSLSNINYIFIYALIIYFLILCEIFIFFKRYLFFTIFYVLISFFFTCIYLFKSFELSIFAIFIFAIIVFDTSSYLIGKSFGKTKIFRIISPKKTLEGLIGGILFTNIIYLIFFKIINIFNFGLDFILINLIILTSLLGDLLQSYLKRKNNLKNSSNFLPGHGGFFDRFDSFLLSVIFLSIFSISL
tara:strand:+ start:4338 stop:4958 length:621 start_codon:yes stop_codon:yes gene_type:complete